MRAFLAALALACLASVAPAEPDEYVIPQQKIEGAAEPVPLGELVYLSLSKMPDAPAHFVSSSCAWKVLDLSDGKEKRVREDGGSIFFGSGIVPKRYKVYCAVTYLYAKKDKDGHITSAATRTVLLSADLTVGEPGPGPKPPEPGPGPKPPGPGPKPPGPDPKPVPDGRFQLARLAVEEGGKITDTHRAAVARAMAGVYRSMAAAVAAGTIKNDAELLKKTREMNDARVAEVAEGAAAPWGPFTKVLGDRLFQLYQDKKLKSLSDYADAWKEIAEGLELLAAR